MPKTHRDLLKRRLAQAFMHVESALGDLHGLHEEFAPGHPGHAKLLELIASGLFQCQDAMKSFALNTWGTTPEDFDKWRD